MSSNNRYVVKHPDGWAVKAPHAQRASVVYPTQAQAQKAAKEIVENNGGGEVVTQNKYGRWRDSDTVAPGNDPFPPRDRKH